MMIKKIIKYFSLFILFSVGLILLLWGVAIYFVVTPEVLTPQVERIMQSYTRSKVSVARVDLSLFARFPNVTLRIDSLCITQTKDSIDDLLFARQCRIAVNPFALLSDSIVVNHVSLRGANVYMYVDSLHGPIKTFILPEAVEPVEEEVEESNFDLSRYAISLRRLNIDSMQIVIDDRNREFYTRVDNFGLDMSMHITSSESDMEVVTGFSNLIVWHKGALLVKKTALDLRSTMLYDADSMQLNFERSRLRLNNIDLRTRGSICRDTVADGVVIDIKSSLNTPSLSEFLALIPSSVIDEKDQITTEGEVQFDIDINGLYSEESMPTIGAKLRVDSASAKYASRKVALEQVDCDAYMYVDFNMPDSSYADVKSLHINTSNIIDLNMSGRFTNIINDPEIDMSIVADFNFDRFSEVFPLNESIVCHGTSVTNIETKFNLSNIQNSNYADMYLDGKSTFYNFDLTLDASKMKTDTLSVAHLSMQVDEGHLLFGNNVSPDATNRRLRSKANFQQLSYVAKSGEYVSVQDLEVMAGVNFNNATSEVNGIRISGVAKSLNVGVDTLFNANLESSNIRFVVKPKNENQSASIEALINSQQITATEPIYNSEMALSTVDMEMSITRSEKDHPWAMNGTVAFSDFGMFSDLFPVDVTIPETQISVNHRTIYLDNAHLTLGRSEFTATGHVENLFQKFFVDPRTMLNGELAINAPLLDFGEIMETSIQSALILDDEEEEEEVADATDVEVADSVTMFRVPRMTNFVLDLNIDKAVFGEAFVDNVEGRATIKDGALSLDKLTLQAIGANAFGAMTYRNIDRTSANIAADMNLAGVDINRIGELIPTINTMFPMLESFEGIVDFDFKVNTNLNSNSMIDIETLYGAMRFKGNDLVVMDSETFADLSKTLMFKNKDRNVIDSVEVFALVAESQIDVLPFAVSIDRYSAVVGGSQTIDPQTFDLEYNYNISIVKSPLPFKAGVDIIGNLEDFDFKITKAKLKKSDFDEQRNTYIEYANSIDASAVALEQELAAKREAMQAQRREQRLAQELLIAQTEAELAVDSLVHIEQSDSLLLE